MLVVIPPASSSPPLPTSSFVTRNPVTGNLELNGVRFRFSGANAANDIGLVSSDNSAAAPPPAGYGGTVHSGSYLTSHAQIDAYLASAAAMNTAVVRAFSAVKNTNHVDAVQPTLGVFNSAALEPTDYALQQCAARGIKLILPLCDEYSSKPWYVAQTGGGGNDQFHTRPATINAFKDHISFVLDHVNPYTGLALKDDPTVLCWETGNELTTSGVSAATFAAWTDTIGAHIKVTKSAQQLVMDGGDGITGDGVTFDTDRLATTYADIHGNHTYDNYRTPAWLTAEANAAHAAGKAWVVGEYSWTGRQYGGASLSWTLDDLLSTIEAESNFDGDCFWDLLSPRASWSDGFTLHYPGDNPDMITRATRLAGHALALAPVAAAVDGGGFAGIGTDTIDGGSFASVGADTIDGGSL